MLVKQKSFGPVTPSNKRLIHDNCKGVVDRHTLVCGRCSTHPPGGEVTLQRLVPKSKKIRKHKSNGVV